MSKMTGIFPLRGTIDGVTFSDTKDGNIAKKKSRLDKARLATDPAFIRTRENGAEFARSATAGKLLRNALSSLANGVSDNRVVSRLVRVMAKVIKSDTVNARGMRTVSEGNTVLLEGFDFNIKRELLTTFKVPFSATINRVTGELAINIPAFVATDQLSASPKATHYRIISAGIEADFDLNKTVVDIKNSGDQFIDNSTTTPLVLTHTMAANSTKPLIIALGIVFFEKVNGKLYPLTDSSFSCLSLVKVSKS